MDWTSIIVAVISALGTGGLLGAIYLRKEKKRQAQLQNQGLNLENQNKIIEQWKEFTETEKKELENAKQERDELLKENRVLRDKCDNLSTLVAKLEIFRCKKIGCIERQPPFATPLGEGENETELRYE